MAKNANHFWCAAVLTLGGVLLTAGCDRGSDTTTTSTPTAAPATKPDNTAANKADRDTNAKTPMDQSENAGDIKMAAEIRRAVMADGALSVNAKNVKIITNNGMVTLRGVVDTASEKDSIEIKARAVSGVTSVDNQITVKNP